MLLVFRNCFVYCAMPYTGLPERRFSAASPDLPELDYEQEPRHGATVSATEGHNHRHFPSHSRPQEDDIDRSYLSEGLEFPEQGLHATRTTRGKH